MNLKNTKTSKLFFAVSGALLTVILLLASFPMIIAADGHFVEDPTGTRDGYAAYLYDNTSGLPTSEANAIAETSDGFIWIGSYGGLIRYDGNSFERYRSTTGIASVVSLFVDSRDNLWIGTNDNGAAVMDRVGNVVMFAKRDGLPSASVRDFAEGPDGLIYVATTQGVAYVDGSGKLTKIDDSLINAQYIRRLETGADGITYALTIDGGIFTLSGGKVGKFFDAAALGIEDVHALHVDPDNPGYLYLGTKKSRVWYGSLETGFPKEDSIWVSPLEYINSIITDGDELWICSNNGVCIYKDDEVAVLKNLPMDSSIEGVMTDYQGNLWFVSSRQGVMKIVQNQFTDIFDKYGIEDAVVNSTCFYDGKLFIGMDTGLVVIGKDGIVNRIEIENSTAASGEKLGYLELISMLDGIRIRSIIKDNEDRLWFSTYGDKGLVRFDHGKVVCFRDDDGMPSNRMRSVYQRSDGKIMVACTGGLVIINGDKIEKTYDSSSGMSNTEILTVCEGSNGDMLVGTDGDGIYVINDDGIRHINTDNGFFSDVIMRIKKDQKRGIYWVVTSNSLAYMTADYQVNTLEHFPYSNNFDLYENSNGEMWVLCSNGIYVVRVDELLSDREISPLQYGIDNGLPAFTTSNSYSCVSDDGNLYIAGTTGVVKANIEKPFEKNDSVKMTVPYIDVDGVKAYPNGDGIITVPYDAKKITVYPYICNYSLTNPMVEYSLEGFSAEPSVVRRTELSTVDYTNLKGGNYAFKMSILDPISGESCNDYSITIVKQMAIYEYLWFKIGLVVLVLMIIAVTVIIYVRRKLKTLLKKQEENRLFIKEIVEAFAKTIDMKDSYTNGHSQRVAKFTAMLTKELGYDEETVEKYYNIALLHDIGKIGVPAGILNKEGKLSDQEFQDIKSHTVLGANVLKDINIMPELSVGAESHHERPDGKGYPKGLKGDEIPRVAQIIAVADAFDAMYSNRPYRKRMNFEKVVSIIKGASGTQLTADVVDAFLRIVDRGGFRAPDDVGGGTTEDIDNIHKRFEKEEHDKQEEEDKKKSETSESSDAASPAEPSDNK